MVIHAPPPKLPADAPILAVPWTKGKPSAHVESDVALVAKVRRTIGDGVRLMLDFNQSQSTAGAVERIRRLQDFDLTWVEEPVAAEDLVGYRAVRERVRPVPIQTGENWWFPQGMANAIAAGASDLAMVDIMKIGGVTGWMAAMAQAEPADQPNGVWNMGGELRPPGQCNKRCQN
jgi:mandelate racemase